MNEVAAAPTPPASPGIVAGVIDLLLRPAAFFQERRPTIRAKSAFFIVLVMAVELVVDRVVRRHGRLAPTAFIAGVVVSVLLVAGPLRYFIGGGLCRLRIRFAGARDVDPAEARALFALSELIRSVTVLTAMLLDLALSPVRPGLSPTFLLAAAWSQFVCYQGVRASFPVSPWKARLWFLLVPGLAYGWLYWKLF